MPAPKRSVLQKKHAVITGLKGQFGDMRNGQSNKGNRACKSGYTSRKYTSSKNNNQSCFAVVEPHTLGVVFTQKQSIKRFDAKGT